MGIVSAYMASIGEQVRQEWVAALNQAVQQQDWAAVRTVLRQMQEFHFYE